MKALGIWCMCIILLFGLGAVVEELRHIRKEVTQCQSTTGSKRSP